MSDKIFKSGVILKALPKKVESVDAKYLEGNYGNNFKQNSIKAQAEYAHLEGVKDHYLHKSKWSRFLMFAVGFMLLFQSVLLVAVGLELLDFSAYQWLLPALLVQNLAQVIGLAVYAVKYLFSDISNQITK